MATELQEIEKWWKGIDQSLFQSSFIEKLDWLIQRVKDLEAIERLSKESIMKLYDSKEKLDIRAKELEKRIKEWKQLEYGDGPVDYSVDKDLYKLIEKEG